MGVISRFLGTAKSIATFSDAEMATTLVAVPARDEYAAVANALPPLSYQFGRPHWPTWDPYAGANAYAKLALIFRCVNIVAHALGTAPVKVTQDDADDEPMVDHPLVTLMKRPNPLMGAASFWSHVGVRAATSGFCVVEKERDRLGNVIGLWPLQSAYLRSKLRRDGRHDWEYRIPGVPDPFPLKAENVIPFRWADTASGSPYGMGPVEGCLREVSLSNALLDFVKAYVERGAAPMFAMIPQENSAPITQAEADALIDAFVARRMGLNNAVRPMYMGAIKDLKTVGNNLEEMAYQALRDMSELAIVQAFGIPASVAQIRVGLEHSDSRANAEVDEGKLYRQTIIPLWTRFDDALTLGLLSEYPDSEKVSLTFDTSDIEALQEDRNAKAVWVNSAVGSGWLSVHTAHREMGLPLPDGDDYFLRSIATEAIPVSEPIPEPEPVPKALQPGNQTQPDDTDVDTQLSAIGDGLTALERYWYQIFGPDGITPAARYRRRYARASSGRVLIAKIAKTREPSIRTFFRDQGKRIIPTITEGYAAGGPAERYVAEAVDWDDEEDELEKVIRKLYALAGETAFEAVGNELGISLSFDLANPKLGAVQQLLAQRVTAITEETRFDVQRVVTESIQEGTTLDELRDRLTGLFEETYKNRSMTIARTESMSSYGYASAAGYRDSGVVDRIQCFDNPDHTESYGASDGLSCAERNGFIAPLENAELHIDAEHPNGSLAISGVLIGEDG